MEVLLKEKENFRNGIVEILKEKRNKDTAKKP